MTTEVRKSTTPPPSQDKPARPEEFERKESPTPITYFKPGQLPTKPSQGGGESGGGNEGGSSGGSDKKP